MFVRLLSSFQPWLGLHHAVVFLALVVYILNR
jgi:hypothetical protein